MSIEAMKMALEALDCLIYDKPYAGRFADALIGLRTAIQQAEAQQPATGEPVGYMNEGHIHEFAMRRIPYGYVYPEAGAGASTAVYTHPAPSDDVVLDAARYRYLRNRTPSDVLGTFGTSAGCWIDCEDDHGALILLTGSDSDAAIDAAMLAA